MFFVFFLLINLSQLKFGCIVGEEKRGYVDHMMFPCSPTASSFVMFGEDLLAFFSSSGAAQPMRWWATVGHGVCGVSSP